MITSVSESDLIDALRMITDMWVSLDSAYNSQMYIDEINSCTTLIHILSTCRDRIRHVPIDVESLRDAMVFVTQRSSDTMLPQEIRYKFSTIQKIMYDCCGYSKVKFNGRGTDN